MRDQRLRKEILAALVFGMWVASSTAFAVTSLKQVQVSNGSQISLLFDGKVQKSQIKTEYLNDIVQLSISDVAVYPAKISSVNGASLTKIFAYQYAPKLVRCRFTVKGKAESYKHKLVLKTNGNGKMLSVFLEGENDIAEKDPKGPDPEEKALLARVLAAESAPVPQAPQISIPSASKHESHDSVTVSAAAPVLKQAETVVPSVHLTGTPAGRLTSGKPLPSPIKALSKTATVLGVFGLLALVLRRVLQKRAGGQIVSAVGRFAKKNLGRQAKMIEVLSTHYLGPKKSIAVVRVAGRMLVIGVTPDAINLITQLSGEEFDPSASAEDVDLGSFLGKAPPREPVFASMLQKEAVKPAVTPSSRVIPGASQESLSSVRAQIRSRLEGLKQL
ncbi:flagellar biosynthetic protein FliO [Bdellovibrionota bacterium FG-1]